MSGDLAEEVRRLREAIDDNPDAREENDVVEELSEETIEEIRDTLDSHKWYRSKGWDSQEMRTAGRLEELAGTADIDELEERFGTREERESDELSEREQKIEDVESAIRWYENHDGWEQAAEYAYDRLRNLKEGG